MSLIGIHHKILESNTRFQDFLCLVPDFKVAQDPLINIPRGVMFISWLRNSLHKPPTPNVMKLFAHKFIQTLMYNLATIAAIVVGLCQFAVRAWNENNGTQKTRKVIQTVLAFIDTLIDRSKVYFAESEAAAAVPVAQVATKSPKRPQG